MEISRRTLLRGAGAALALPVLEAMASTPRSGPPARMVAIYVPIGKNMDTWTPKTEGEGFALPEALTPLAEFRKEFSILTGLCHPQVWGSHGTEAASWLTAANILSGTPGCSWKNTVSMDQIAAEKIGPATRFPSLELIKAGPNGAGMTVAYTREGVPLAPEMDPLKAFERLFVDGSAGGRKAQAAVLRETKSVLDLVREDYKRLESRIGKADRDRLDQYATSVREVEQRLTRAEEWLDKPKQKVTARPPESDPSGGRNDRGAHMRAMADVMALALQTDSTRVITYAVSDHGAPIRDSGVNDGHHGLSHHGNDAEKKKKLTQIDRFHVTQLAYFLKKLKSTPDGAGSSLLDSTMVLYGSGLSDGSRHSQKDLPVLLAGNVGGKLKQGVHRRYPSLKTPMSNLFVVMLNLLGVPVPSFADSTGPLEHLT
jgi:hypothetical protein